MLQEPDMVDNARRVADIGVLEISYWDKVQSEQSFSAWSRLRKLQ
jgi:hypothetical protein